MLLTKGKSDVTPLPTKKEVKEKFESSLKIYFRKPPATYRKSTNKLPPHPVTKHTRWMCHDQVDESLWVFTNAGPNKDTYMDEFGPLALCRTHENILNFRETYFYNGNYIGVTEVPCQQAFSLESLMKKIFAKANKKKSLNLADQYPETRSKMKKSGKSKSKLRKSAARLAEEPLVREDLVLYILNELLKGIAYFHEKNIVHRDIVPKNVLVGSDGSIKISDTLYAFPLTEEKPKAKGPKGKVNYMSPEAMRGWEYGTLADIWSFGVCAIRIGENRLVASDKKSEKEIMSFIIKNKAPSLSTNVAWSAGFKAMHSSCMQHNITSRLTAAKLLKMKVWSNATSKDVFIDFLTDYFPPPS